MSYFTGEVPQWVIDETVKKLCENCREKWVDGKPPKDFEVCEDCGHVEKDGK